MNLRDFADEVHANAEAHGWWDGENDPAEIVALIHSEWSEALQAYRNGEEMLVYNLEKLKPEGVAVELIDGCLRILDWIGAMGIFENKCIDIRAIIAEAREYVAGKNLQWTVATLHAYTTQLWDVCEDGEDDGELDSDDMMLQMVAALGVALRWVQMQGIDPEELMREKLEYNKTRPYRHGGKLC